MIRPIGPTPARIMIVGESPSEKDVEEGVPFTGTAGRILDGLLRDADIVREQCYITNVLLERTVKGKTGAYYEDKTKRRPTENLQESIRRLHGEMCQVQPNIVVAMGEEALRAVCGKRGIYNWRGSVLRSTTGHKVIPTLHPSALLVDWTLRPAVIVDLQRVREQSTTPDIHITPREFVVAYNYEEALKHLEEIRTHAKEIAFDIENETNQITSIAIAPDFRPNWAVSIPFWFGQSGSLFSKEQELRIWEVLREILTDQKIGKIAHNAVYDVEFINRTLGFNVRPVTGDTMLMLHALYLELPKSLAFAVSLYTDHPYYKEGLYADKMDEFFKYNATDACLTMEVYNKLKKELHEDNLWQFYQQFLNSLIEPIVAMQLRGVKFDYLKRNSVKKRVQEEIAVLQKRVNVLTGRELNTNSPAQMKEWLYGDNGLGLKERTRKDKTTGEEKVSADQEALESAYNETGNEAIRLILQIREKQKILGTYLEVNLDEDKRIRCSYNISGTETGRLSSGKTTRSTGTNLQNIPSGIIRSLFIADTDCTFINADLSQAEARVVAYLANEPGLIRVFDEGGDIHRKNAANIFKCREEEVTDNQRQLAKKVVHASNYGMGPITFARTAGLETAEAKRLLNQYFATYPNLVNWQLSIKNTLRNKRFLTNPFGRKRLFFSVWEEKIYKEGLAFIPQSTVADIVTQALVCMHKKGLDLLLQVHDSVLVQCPDNKVAETVEIVKQCLSIPIEINGRVLKIPVDVKVGKNWDEMEKWKGE